MTIPTTRSKRSRRMPASMISLSGRATKSVLATGILAVLAIALTVTGDAKLTHADVSHQAGLNTYETPFAPGPAFNVNEVVYPEGHDFDPGAGADGCLSVSVPAGDIFTLSLSWEPLFEGPAGPSDLDLYVYLDSACTESALLTSSFNSNAYTGELLEVTPSVQNIGTERAVGGIRIGKRSGRGNVGAIKLRVITGSATFLEHDSQGPPLEGQEGAPEFQFQGPFSIPENSPAGTSVGAVIAVDDQLDPITYFELESTEGQGSFEINPTTGEITVEDPALLDRETTETLVYWIGVTDGAAASLVGVGVNLTGVNDNAPVASPQQVTTYIGTPVMIELVATDADIDPAQSLTISTVDAPVFGTLSQAVATGVGTATVLYTPNPGFSGEDTFTFEASDGLAMSPPAAVVVTVTEDADLAATPTPTPEATATGPSGESPGAPPSSGPGPVGAPEPSPAEDEAPEDAVPPSAPRSVRAEGRDGAVVFTWQRPLWDGGAPITGYRVFNVNTATPTLIEGDVLDARVMGLQNGTNYLFQVRAFNAAGAGEPVLVGPVGPKSASPAEIAVRASVHPDDSITVWWSAPEDERLDPVAKYSLWTAGGELLAEPGPEDELILNLKHLGADREHAFRVTAVNEDGELIAVGETQPVYLPPTFASTRTPPPVGAILVDLESDVDGSLQEAIREAADGPGIVIDTPATLTLRDGEAELFIRVDGLYRGLELAEDFAVETERLAFDLSGDPPVLELEIAPGVLLSGVAELSVDPSGILFRITEPVMKVVYSPAATDPATSPDPNSEGSRAESPVERPVARIEIVTSPHTLESDFGVRAEEIEPEAAPEAVTEIIEDPSTVEAVIILPVEWKGIAAEPSLPEQIEVAVDTEWHEAHRQAGHTPVLHRVDEEGEVESQELVCEIEGDPGSRICSAQFENGLPVDSSIARNTYVLTIEADLPAPTPTPEAERLSAPSEPPESPEDVSGAANSQPIATVAPVVVATPEPTATVVILAQASTPAATELSPPVLPGPGGLDPTVIVTWVMGGVLGLVAIRGAFYTVGKIRA